MIVWEDTTKDGLYFAQVVRLRDHVGTLTVREVKSGASILTQDVTLSYDAKFGPDVADVVEWQETATDAINTWEAK